jgi:actinorhodin biosynthesis protein ActVIA
MLKRSMLATVLATLILGSATWLPAQQRSARLTGDDYIEIQQLYARYNNAIDSGDAEAYAATFVPDGTFNTFTGHDALVGFIHDWHEKMGGANRRHWNTNLTITPTSEGASGSVYLLLVDVGVRPPAIQAAAKYEDQLVKTSDGWRFKKRVTHNEGPPRTAAAAGKK